MSNNKLMTLLLTLVGSVALLAGCASSGNYVQTIPANPCAEQLPETNRLGDAIVVAEEILQDCPERQQEIFLELLDIGKRNPGVQNREQIIDLYKRLMEFEVINVKEARAMLTRYFYLRFAAVDTVEERFSSMSDRALDRVSMAIDDELALKEIGLVQVSDAQDQYEKAKEYAERMQDILESTKIQWSHLRREQAR